MDTLRLARSTMDGKWRWQRRDPAGKVVATSGREGYVNVQVCEDEMFRINNRPYRVIVHEYVEPWDEWN